MGLPCQCSSVVQRSSAVGSRAPDEIDGDAAALDQQAGDTHGGAGRRIGEKFLPDLVEGVKVVEVRQEHLRLDDVVQRAAGRGERVLQMIKRLSGNKAFIRQDLRSYAWQG